MSIALVSLSMLNLYNLEILYNVYNLYDLLILRFSLHMDLGPSKLVVVFEKNQEKKGFDILIGFQPRERIGFLFFLIKLLGTIKSYNIFGLKNMLFFNLHSTMCFSKYLNIDIKTKEYGVNILKG
jgi:hypothetical protein